MANHINDAYDDSSKDVEMMLGLEVSPSDPDRAIIEPWAATVTGPILDAGSGTGRWAGQLASRGFLVEGLEPAERLVKIAKANHPSVTFHHASIADLPQLQRKWGGILAWYSLIHMTLPELQSALATLHAALADGGSLLMSFFTAPHRGPFNHPIATAYLWPMADMGQILATAGFEVVEQHSNSHGPHAYINARAMCTPRTLR